LSQALTHHRYITQLRDGCQDSHCNKPTCFTARRRAAGSRPLRRYNATSARTLACFLASQDSPEKDLCQALKGLGLKGSANNRFCGPPSKIRISVEGNGHDGIRSINSRQLSQQNSRTSPTLEPTTPHQSKDILGTPNGNKSRTRRISTRREGESITEQVRLAANALEQPVKKDHKSFVQNMFGTVAFRMIEWLTPSNLEALISSNTHEQEISLSNDNIRLEEKESTKAESLSSDKDVDQANSQETYVSDSLAIDSIPSQHVEKRDSVFNDGPPLANLVDGQNEPSDGDMVPSKMQNQSAAKKSRPRDVEGSAPQHVPVPSIKHLNTTTAADSKDRGSADHNLYRNGLLESQGMTSPKRPRRRPSAITSSNSLPEQADISSFSNNGQSPTTISPRHIVPGPKIAPAKDAESQSDESPVLPDRTAQAHHVVPFEERAPEKPIGSVPQSLDHLTIEVIDLFCNILQHDLPFNMNAEHVRFPYKHGGKERLRNTESTDISVDTALLFPASLTRFTSTHPQWRLFIEQSLFYVLSSPPELMRSFYEGNTFLDTQTIWYCMTRLTQHFPTMIFECLWMSAADLYSPTQEVWPFLGLTSSTSVSGMFTAEKTADMMSLCLHALIAAVPYVNNGADLYTISRLRSCGLSHSQARRMSPDLAQLCLLCDDVFSNEMALRLARRVFAAIPVRRRYQELLALNTLSESPLPRRDILDMILKPLNFLDIEVPPTLNFTPEERQLHEKRAPTLLIDWARTVMLQDWNGLVQVPVDGPFGGALAMIQAICKLFDDTIHD
jgi:hypothetical protein